MNDMTQHELTELTHQFRSNPHKCLELANQYIQQDPAEYFGYFVRHQIYMKLGRYWDALSDINFVIATTPQTTAYYARGCIYHKFGEYQKALEDFDRADALDPVMWSEGFPLLYRADCHARLGNEAAALAECARLRDDYWAPSLFGLPGGDKEQAPAEIRRRVAAARRGSAD